MKIPLFLSIAPARRFAALLVGLALAGQGLCAPVESKAATHQARAANPHQNPYEARSYPSRLEIFKAGKQVSVIQSEGSEIERWGFIDGGQQVAVKTRNVKDETVLELFETATGIRKEQAVAPTNAKGQMSWADGFID